MIFKVTSLWTDIKDTDKWRRSLRSTDTKNHFIKIKNEPKSEPVRPRSNTAADGPHVVQ
jgi:hypothetical protein